jgi:hypothetical protein
VGIIGWQGIVRVAQWPWQVDFHSIHGKQAPSEPAIGFPGLLVSGDDAAIESLEYLLVEFSSCIAKGRCRHWLGLGQSDVHALALRPKFDNGGAVALVIFREHQAEDKQHQ